MSQEQYLAVYFNCAYTQKKKWKYWKVSISDPIHFFFLFTRLLQECHLQLSTS